MDGSSRHGVSLRATRARSGGQSLDLLARQRGASRREPREVGERARRGGSDGAHEGDGGGLLSGRRGGYRRSTARGAPAEAGVEPGLGPLRASALPVQSTLRGRSLGLKWGGSEMG